MVKATGRQKKTEEPEPKQKKTGEPEPKKKKAEKHEPQQKIVDEGGKVFKNPKFDSLVTKNYMGLRKLKRAHKFDFSIKVGETEIPVHKKILLKRCLYFRKMLKHNWTETSSNTISVPFNLDMGMWSQIIDYLYSATITITLENMFDICTAAGYLILDKLREFCEAFIKMSINHSTVEQICVSAEQTLMHDMAQFCTNFMEVNFEEFTKHKEMLEWAPKLVERLVKSDKLQVRSEAKVVQMVCNWLNFQYDSRKHLTKNLLDQIRYTCPHKFADAIDEDVCLSILHHCLHNLKRSAALQREHRPRLHYKCIYMFGCVYTHKEQYMIFNRYWPNDQSLVPLQAPELRINWSSTILDDKLYLIGGSFELLVPVVVSKVEAYDPTEDTWSPKCPLSTPRSDHCSCSYKGQIYVFGGVGKYKNERLRSEMYSPVKDQWQYLDDNYKPKAVTGAAVVGDSIFVVSRSERLNNRGCFIQQFKPEQNEWTDLADNELLCNQFAYDIGPDVVSLGKKIYIGKSGNTYIVYDPESNRFKKEFFLPASKRESFQLVRYRRNGGMVVFRDRIYAYGGARRNSQDTKYVHNFGVFDPRALVDPSDNMFQFTTSVESDIFHIQIVS